MSGQVFSQLTRFTGVDTGLMVPHSVRAGFLSSREKLNIERRSMCYMQTIPLLNTNIRYTFQDRTIWYCLVDITAAVDYNKSGYSKFYNRYMNQITIKPFTIISNGGSRPALFADDSSLKFLLAKCRKPKVPELIVALGYSEVLAAPTKEAIYVTQLLQMFPSLKFIEQYQIDKFRVDLYSPVYNMIVECDEMNHQGYKNDALRTKKINETQKNPTWIRFNPDAPGFTIIDLISQITTAMTLSNQVFKSTNVLKKMGFGCL